MGRLKVRSPQARNAAESNPPESLLGKKVSILFRLSGDPDHPFSEVVGVVQRETASGGRRELHVLKRDGTLVQVADEDIVKMKIVPTRS